MIGLIGVVLLLTGLALRRAYRKPEAPHPGHERLSHQPQHALLAGSVEGLLTSAATGLIWFGTGCLCVELLFVARMLISG
jgi:hypothetical protein